MDILDGIYKRHSTRSFCDKPVSNENVKAILAAAGQAPSPKNKQPWRFIVVRDEAIKGKIADILKNKLKELQKKNDLLGVQRNDINEAFESVRIIMEAPVIIFVYMNINNYEMHDDGLKWDLNAKDVECTYIMSIGAAIENMLLAATEKEVDSLWMADVFYAYNEMVEYLKIDGCMMSAMALGYANKIQNKVKRKTLEDIVYWY